MYKKYNVNIDGEIKKGSLLMIDLIDEKKINATVIKVHKIRIGPKWKEKAPKKVKPEKSEKIKKTKMK